MILSYDTVSADPAPQRFLYVLHGIFGAGRNWASVARRLVRDRPDWGVRLVDVRQHGSSQGFPPPNTLEAAARDLFALATQLGEEPAGLLGHSFGGKVVLQYARDHGAGLEQIWVIDSTPDARPPSGSAWDMLQRVRAGRASFAARQDVVAWLSEGGLPVATAQWMATNLELQDGRYRWRFDLNAVEELLHSFFETDLWSVVEEPPARAHLHIVKAAESSVLTPQAIERVRQIAVRAARVHYHEVAGGHWVNADNPDALHALLSEYL